jgi:beta-barrel assembly-enhancing protease
MKTRHLVISGLLTTMLLALAACQTASILTDVGTSVAVATGTINEQQADSIRRGSESLTRAFEQLTPEQEYYIGRSVTAAILENYPPLETPDATDYINTLGRALALFSRRPETFGGWHFLIMDTDEINAFAAPGGFILVSRGMLQCTTNEDELAAVIAHEIAHVEKEHGLRAIRQSRWTTAFTILGTEAAANLGGRELAQLTTAFEGAISDVTTTLATSGYSRALEREADAAAVAILQQAGYNPEALVTMLQNMQERLGSDKRGFASTHPQPRDRIRDIRKILKQSQPVDDHPQRAARFTAALRDL